MEAFGFILLLLAPFFYFIPAYVGSVRNAEHGGSIFFINLLLFGWTVLGWFAALIRAHRQAKAESATQPQQLVPALL